MLRIFHVSATAVAIMLYFVYPGSAFAVMSGPCSGCHTMHNSQDNQPMRFDSGSTPLPQLLRGDCYGCHAQGLNEALPLIGIDVIPQVYHTDTSQGDGLLDSDLAGGNFAYITGAKGGGIGNPDSRGHNIAGLLAMVADGNIYAPPGGIVQSFHNTGFNVNTNTLRCAGTNGCHGNRYYRVSGVTVNDGISGAHHNNVNGAVTQGAGDVNPGHGYRFLLGVNGYEDTDWQYTKSDAEHNEYAGESAPIQLGCGGGTMQCHGSGGVRPPRGTMAEYCATCHGNFHTLETSSSDGIGTTASSPFIRHPSDLSIPGAGEYAAYTSYLTVTPVARINGTYASGTSSTVTPGTDAVFCLSCHVAHASPYPDMLKWDYATMEVGNGGAASGTGCFACHSTKD
jgi:hypothetical protein